MNKAALVFSLLFFITSLNAVVPKELVEAIQASDEEVVSALLHAGHLSGADLIALREFANNIILKRTTDMHYDYRSYMKLCAKVTAMMISISGPCLVIEGFEKSGCEAPLPLMIPLILAGLAGGIYFGKLAFHDIFLQKGVLNELRQRAIKIKLLLDLQH